MRFEHKTVLITGAAGTIGMAAAEAFFKEGADLALVDFDMPALEAVAGRFGNRALLLQADVTDEAQVAAYVGRTVDRFGKIDVFHNNAGITGQRAAVTDMDLSRFKALIDVNVVGVMLGMKYVLRQMYAQNNGVIINTASHKGRVCVPNGGDYAASKSAVITLTKVAALEAAPHHVRINCVMPGIVHSPMIVNARRRADPSLTEEDIAAIFSKTVPLGRWCEPEEVADMVLFLASDQAAYLTGTELRLDGGTTASYT